MEEWGKKIVRNSHYLLVVLVVVVAAVMGAFAFQTMPMIFAEEMTVRLPAEVNVLECGNGFDPVVIEGDELRVLCQPDELGWGEHEVFVVRVER